MKIEPNKRYILDTNVWIKAVNEGEPHYVTILKYCIENAFIICPINNLVEIIHNLTMIRDSYKKLQRRDNAFYAIDLIINLIENSKIKIVFPTQTQILQAIDQYNQRENSTDIIQIFDFMIAYSGIDNADYIISDDHHFKKIYQLRLNEFVNSPIVIRPSEIEID